MPDTGKLTSKALAVTDYLVPFPTPYKRAVLNQNPINMQIMSILDTKVNHGKHLSSFAKGGAIVYDGPLPVHSEGLVTLQSVLHMLAPSRFYPIRAPPLSNHWTWSFAYFHISFPMAL